MPFITNASAIIALDEWADLVDVGSTDANGDCVFYDGTPPTNADTALSGNTVLATIELNSAPAFAGATDGTDKADASLNGLPKSDTSIDATGTCTFCRLHDRDNATVGQFTVGTSATDVIVNSTAFQITATFTLNTFVVTLPES